MNSTDKFALIGALLFFFICITATLIWVKTKEAESPSYMPVANADQASPLQNINHNRVQNLPESVLHYSSADTARPDTVECMLDDDYKNRINAAIAQDDYKLSVMGNMGDDKMEIYTNISGNFFVVIKGDDILGNTESCFVAKGEKWLDMP